MSVCQLFWGSALNWVIPVLLTASCLYRLWVVYGWAEITSWWIQQFLLRSCSFCYSRETSTAPIDRRDVKPELVICETRDCVVSDGNMLLHMRDVPVAAQQPQSILLFRFAVQFVIACWKDGESDENMSLWGNNRVKCGCRQIVLC